ANNNPPRNARTVASAPASRRNFYAVLAVIAIIGAGAIYYLTRDSSAGTGGAEAQAAYAAAQRDYAKAGPPKPYMVGNSSAPVVIEEFADFECPVCGSFATVTEPDVRKNIVDAGLAYYKYYDFPLPMHHNTVTASNAAACADEQGKFWQMHDQLFAGQDAWGLNPDGATQVTDNPVPVFEGYAKTLGLNATQFNQCLESKKYQSRVNANAAEGFKRNVNQTPTFFINGKMFAGSIPYDVLKKAVDDAAAAAKTSPAAAAPAK
ncbi:MAG: DsbA family protein, partial [Gemmatimonadota bacterium]|nr:DsbA family protein [Gemmatimonadota bacterium]